MAEPFPEAVVQIAWARSCGCCECERITHGHDNKRCCKQLLKQNRGREMEGAWETHHINPNAPPSPQNCQILCWNCHKQIL